MSYSLVEPGADFPHDTPPGKLLSIWCVTSKPFRFRYYAHFCCHLFPVIIIIVIFFFQIKGYKQIDRIHFSVSQLCSSQLPYSRLWTQYGVRKHDHIRTSYLSYPPQPCSAHSLSGENKLSKISYCCADK